MSNLALYREYRPQKFTEILGQDSTVSALKNAVKRQKLAHAYLFYGSRGTGKTTTARILAKVVNCFNAKDAKACEKCSSCSAAKTGNAFDVVEIDAASNNGIDSVREIREKVKILPIQSKYKFYIIDEIHMLSNSAFNALLKTLEEPPIHVIFILATTEYYKVPITVRSRCQQYEFKLISERLICQNLTYILKTKKILFDEEALTSIYQLSGGSLRDALTLLEKVIIFSDKRKITLQSVNRNFGLATKQQILQMLRAILKENLVDQLDLIKKLKNFNIDCYHFLWQLIGVLKKSLEFKITQRVIFLKPNLLECKTAILKIKTVVLNKLISLLFMMTQDIKNFSRPWFYLELSLISLESFDTVAIKDQLKKTPKFESKFTNKINKEPSLLAIKNDNSKLSLNIQSHLPSKIKKSVTSIVDIWKEGRKSFNQNFGSKKAISDNLYLQEWAYNIWFNNESQLVLKVNNRIKSFFKESDNIRDLISLYKTKVVAKYKSILIILTPNTLQSNWVYWQFNQTKTRSIFSSIFSHAIKNLVVLAFSEIRFKELEIKFQNRRTKRPPSVDLKINKLHSLLESLLNSFSFKNNFDLGKQIFTKFQVI